MKTIVVTFAVLLFLLTLLGSFGGSIRSAEPFYNPIPPIDEKPFLDHGKYAEPKKETYEDGLLRGPTMMEKIKEVVDMATPGTSATNPVALMPKASSETFYNDMPEAYGMAEGFYEPPPGAPMMEETEEKIEQFYVPEPFEVEGAAAAPF